MLNENINNSNKPTKRGLKLTRSTMPRLSLSLHTMPRSSDQHLKKWVLWGLLILLGMVIIAYFLFN